MHQIKLTFISVILLLTLSTCSATLYESYTINPDDDAFIYGQYHEGQQFTVGATGVNEEFTVDNVKVLAYTVGTPGTLYVDILAVDGLGFPIDLPISSGTIDGNMFTTDPNGVWETVTMSSGILSASTQYVVVFSVGGGDNSNKVVLKSDFTGAGYPAGHDVYSLDGGVSWNDGPADSAILFEINGTATGGGGGSTAFEYFNTGEDGTDMITQLNWSGQTFTVGTTGVNEDVALTSVKVKMQKVGSGMGAMYVELYDVDGVGFPTGLPIGAGSIAEVDMPTSPTWTEIIMAPSDVLTASTQYALVFNTQGDGANYILLDVALTGGYLGGEEICSTDGGVNWNHGGAITILFEAYGTPKGTLHESSADTSMTEYLWDNNKVGQVFTVGTTGVNENFTVSTIQVNASVTGYPNDAFVAIQAVSGGLPTGPDLSTGKLGSLGLTSTPTWVNIVMSEYELQASTEYVFTITPDGSTYSDYMQISRSSTSVYAGGTAVAYPPDPWGLRNDQDLAFGVYGEGGADITPPTTSITCVAGDMSPPYVDVVNDNATTAHIAGEENMVCRWDTIDLIYGDMNPSNNCSIVGSDATCPFGDVLEGYSHLRYVSCEDSLGNGQSTDQNLDITFDVVFNDPPTLTSVLAHPNPIKGGNTVTVTPSGQGDNESDTLYYYCDSTNTPTSANTDCSQGNAPYSTPYSEMTCTYASPTDDIEHTVYCRTYDGESYSPARSSAYTTDSTPPSLSITSVEGDVSAPYVDTVDDTWTAMVLEGEIGMACLWSSVDQAYGDMSPTNTCNTVGSETTCNVSSVMEGPYTFYVACKDSLENEASAVENTQVDFTVTINDIPTLTSVLALPNPIKGGNTVTVTPTGQGDEESDTLYYYCDSTTTPTSANTDCSEGNAPYASPYSGMTCTYASPVDNTEHTVYCRTYDGNTYSPAQSSAYTTDSTAPSTSITNIGGDTSPPYVDVTNDDATNAVISGEANMVCRWATTDLTYSNMVNDCSVVGSDATCAFGNLANNSYTRFVSCDDSLGNAQTTGNNLDLSFDVNTNDIPTLTSVLALPNPIKGGNVVTVAPTGQGDGDSDNLYYYCDSSTTPTSVNTDCSQGNASYASPYSGMTCTYASPTDDIEHTVYCRTYDGVAYSPARSSAYTTDSTAPSTSITSIGGDASAPYVDVTGDGVTDAVISGEANMVCRWDTADLTYSNMGNDCSIIGSDATCAFGNLVNGNYTRYVSCDDSLGNAQTTDNNLDLSFDVTINFGPTLTSISALPNLVKGGNTVTVTPTGQGDNNLDNLYYYCDSTTTPTSVNTDCSQGNASYSPPYSGMTCTYASPTDDIEHTVYCRTYDGASYSPARSSAYTTDSTAPPTSITSVAGDSSSPYTDAVDDFLTEIIIAGETDMVCRWDTADLTYSNMGNVCSIIGSDATCNIIGLGQGNYIRYVSCDDDLGNAQTTGNNLDISFKIDWNDSPVISDVVSTSGVIVQGEDVDFTITWTDPDSGEDVKAHVCKENGIIGQECVGGAWVEDSGFGSVSPIELTYTTTLNDFGSPLFYVFVCDNDNLCSAASSGSFTMNLAYGPTYVGEDIPPISVDIVGSVLMGFVLLVELIGILIIVMWIKA